MSLVLTGLAQSSVRTQELVARVSKAATALYARSYTLRKAKEAGDVKAATAVEKAVEEYTDQRSAAWAELLETHTLSVVKDLLEDYEEEQRYLD